MNRLSSLFSPAGSWFWRCVMAPLIITRLLLLLIGYYALEFRPDSDYPQKAAVRAGWSFSPYRWLDIWGRWDSGWYMSIVVDGYQPSADVREEQSNLPFFPLYPSLVRALVGLLPGQVQLQQILLVGVFLSNLCLVGVGALLYLFTRRLLHDERAAERAVWYLLLFPAGFFLSAFYTEALFLFLLLLTFWLAQGGRWAAAGVAGFFLALARLPGILALPPLLWLYLEHNGWRIRPWKWPRLDRRSLWLALPPAGLAVFFWIAYQASGDLLAPIHAHAAWGRSFAWPWVTLLAQDANHPQFNEIERASLLAFLLLSLYALRRLPSPAYGFLSLLLLFPPLTSGALISVTRICLTVFPAFIALSDLGGRWRTLDRLVWIFFLAFQALLFAGWCQFYWAG